MLKNRSSSPGSPRRARVQTRLPPFARPGFGRAGDRATARWDCGSDFLFLETYLRGSRDAGRGVIWVIEQSFAPGGGVNVSLVTYYDCACVARTSGCYRLSPWRRSRKSSISSYSTGETAPFLWLDSDPADPVDPVDPARHRWVPIRLRCPPRSLSGWITPSSGATCQRLPLPPNLHIHEGKHAPFTLLRHKSPPTSTPVKDPVQRERANPAEGGKKKKKF